MGGVCGGAFMYVVSSSSFLGSLAERDYSYCWCCCWPCVCWRWTVAQPSRHDLPARAHIRETGVWWCSSSAVVRLSRRDNEKEMR